MSDLEDRFNTLMEQIEAERSGEEAEDNAWEVMQVVNDLGVTEDQAVSMLNAYDEELEERGFPEEAFREEMDGIIVFYEPLVLDNWDDRPAEVLS